MNFVLRIASGLVTTLAGSATGSADGTGVGASFTYPTGIAVSSLTGVIYVADFNTNTIRMITSKWTIIIFLFLKI